tara:strand:+ start:1069 stop:1440 length:372 start_codon:yes stop_codon:yes gene_type:complete
MKNQIMKLDPLDMANLTRKINQLQKIDKQGLSNELGKMALITGMKMKEIAPFDTGNLKGKITAVNTGKTVVISSKAPYSGFVEFGKGNPKTKETRIPFFYPTIRREVKTLLINLENKINKAIK